MTKRVCQQAERDDELRLEFQAAAAREGCSAAQVLRKLMAGYVEMQTSSAGSLAKLRYGVERCTAALLVKKEPGEAAKKLLAERQRELDALVERQYGWSADAHRNDAR